MDVVLIALLVSVVCNLVQIVFYVSKVCIDYRKYKENKEEEKKRASYNNLQEPSDGIWI